MTVPVPNIENAPRSIEELSTLSPYGIRRLAETIAAKDLTFYGGTEGDAAAGRAAFMSADKHSQATRIHHWLSNYDRPVHTEVTIVSSEPEPEPVQVPSDTVQESPSAKREPKTRKRQTAAVQATEDVTQGITLEQMNKLASDVQNIAALVAKLTQAQSSNEAVLNMVLGMAGYSLEVLTGMQLKDVAANNPPNLTQVATLLKGFQPK